MIPYGGAVVGILSEAMKASSAQSAARTRTEFALRRLKDVELAAGGRTNGSAFLPRIRNPIAVVLDLERGDRFERLELPLGERPEQARVRRPGRRKKAAVTTHRSKTK